MRPFKQDFIPGRDTIADDCGGTAEVLFKLGGITRVFVDDRLLRERLFTEVLLDDKIDGIFTFGKACAKALQLIKEMGFANAHSFDSHEELAKKLKDYLKPGDIILLKGSRGMQMEKVLAYL